MSSPLEKANDIKHKIYQYMDELTAVDSEQWIKRGSRPRTVGHCAAVSVIIQDQLGGQLVSCLYYGVSHWYNELPSKMLIDATGDQFGTEYEAIRPIKSEDLRWQYRVRRHDALNDDTLRRAALLATRAGLPIPKICLERLPHLRPTVSAATVQDSSPHTENVPHISTSTEDPNVIQIEHTVSLWGFPMEISASIRKDSKFYRIMKILLEE